ncbi:MAG: GAF domain-containing protein [Anaerolineae bacterium]
MANAYHTILWNLCNALSAEHTCLYMHNVRLEMLVAVQYAGRDTAHRLVIDMHSADPVVHAYFSAQPHQGAGETALPILDLAEGRTVGVLLIRRDEALSSGEILLAMQAAGQLRVALDTTPAEALFVVAESLLNNLDLDVVLKLLLEHCLRLLPIVTGSVVVADGDKVSYVALHNISSNSLNTIVQNSVLMNRVLDEKRIIAIPDVREHSDWVPHPATDHVRGWMGVPLIVGSRAVGALMLDAAQVDPFTPSHRATARDIASIAAIAVDRARLFRSKQEMRLQAEALVRVARTLGSTLDVHTVFRKAVDSVETVFPNSLAAVFLLDGSGPSIPVRSSRSTLTPAQYQQIVADLTGDPSLIETLATAEKPLVIPDTQAQPPWRPPPSLQMFRSLMAVPLRTQHAGRGALLLAHHEPHVYTPEQIELGEAFAGLVTAAVNNADLYERTLTSLRESEILYQVSRGLLASPDPQGITQAVAAMLSGGDELSVTLARRTDEADKWLVGGHACRGVWPEVLGEVFGGPDEWMPPNLEPVMFGSRAEAIGAMKPAMDAQGVGSVAVLPLGTDGRIDALRAVRWREARTFSSTERYLMRALGPQLSAIYDNYELARRHRIISDRFEDVLLNTSDAVWEIDDEGILTFIAGRSVTELGYTPEELLGRYFGEITTREGFRDLRRAAVNDGTLVRFEGVRHPVIAKDGHSVWHETSALVLRGGSGHRGISRNIQEKRELEERERFAFAIGQQLMSVLSMDDLLQEIVRAVHDKLGYYFVHIRLYDQRTKTLHLAQEAGRVPATSITVNTVIALDQRPSLIAAAARTLNPVIVNDVTIDSRYWPAPNLPETRAEAAFPLFRGGRLLGVLDVQSRRLGAFTESETRLRQNLAAQATIAVENARLYRALEEQAMHLEQLVEHRTERIREEQERTQAILENAGEGILLMGTDGTVAYANPALLRLIDLTDAGDLVGQLFSLLGLSRFVRSRPALRQIVSAVQQGESWQGVLRIRRQNTSEFDANLTVTSGESGRLVLILRDVTAEREVERMRTRFVESISHELRTPLTTIKLYHTLLRSGEASKRETYLETMATNITRLERLVEDLLDISQMSRGRITINLDEYDLNALVEEVTRAHQHQAENQRQRIELDLMEGLPTLFGDRERIGQVLTNLVTNCLKYSEVGDRIGVRTLALSGGRVALVVWDEGIGIPAEDQPFVFNRFFRGSGLETVRRPGTGLGLSIVKEIIETHGGEITLESERGAGTTVTVILPVTVRPEV